MIISKEFDSKAQQLLITDDFLSSLFDLFKSPDPMERDYLKTIVHRLYGKFMTKRPSIRAMIAACLSVEQDLDQ